MRLGRSVPVAGVLGLLCIIASPAAGAPAGSGTPTIRSVAPLSANVGDRLTITGRNLAAGARKHTSVVFKVAGKLVSVKAERATAKKITLVIPAKLATYMAVTDGAVQPTRFRLRVNARTMGRRFTPLALSPVIGTSSGVPGTVADGLDGLLPDLPGVDLPDVGDDLYGPEVVLPDFPAGAMCFCDPGNG